MPELEVGDRTYVMDDAGFLSEYASWTESFAEALAPSLKIPEPLTERHWAVIRTIRSFYERFGQSPVVFSVCRENGLRLAELGRLFPTGYLRGACRLAGLSYVTAYSTYPALTRYKGLETPAPGQELDERGFLRDAESWTREFAGKMWRDLGHPGPLTEAHWRVLFFLRERFLQERVLPTVFDTALALGLDAPEMERLFPDGYNRGAVRLAGLAPAARPREFRGRE
jgi:tRNA 2-thiouridine synthesizing protein E